jgi:thiol-disulfide isomerase/thioredoxin
MKNKILLLYILLIGIAYNLHAQETYHIVGSIGKENNGKDILLFTMEGDSICSIDRATIKNGKFHFEGKENLRDFAIITIGNFPNEVKSLELALEKGTIYVNMDSVSVATGTYFNDLYNTYVNESNSYKNAVKSLMNEDENNVILKKNKLDSLSMAHNAFRKEFIKKQVSNIVGFKTLRDAIKIFTESEISELSSYNERIKSDSNIQDQIQYLKELNQLNIQRKKAIGVKYQDFQLEEINGNHKRISDYVGKSDYLFIDFWASWCSPCIASMPYIKEAYDKYKDKGLSVIAVSLDQKKVLWLGSLKRIKVELPQFLIKEEQIAAIKEAYKIKEIPYAILLDKEGTIIKTYLRGETLDECMNSLINNSN